MVFNLRKNSKDCGKLGVVEDCEEQTPIGSCTVRIRIYRIIEFSELGVSGEVQRSEVGSQRSKARGVDIASAVVRIRIHRITEFSGLRIGRVLWIMLKPQILGFRILFELTKNHNANHFTFHLSPITLIYLSKTIFMVRKNLS